MTGQVTPLQKLDAGMEIVWVVGMYKTTFVEAVDHVDLHRLTWSLGSILDKHLAVCQLGSS